MEPIKNQVMTRNQVRAFDQQAIDVWKVPGVILMENAGLACAQAALSMLPSGRKGSVFIFCGTGNNGGDGYVIARHLMNHGVHVRLIIFGDITKVRGDARVHLTVLKNLNMPIEVLKPEQIADLNLSQSCVLIIDALLGTGLNGPLNAPYRQLIETINGSGLPILAVDIPSGLDCDRGVPLGCAIKANQTVSFVAIKAGFQNPEATQYTGRVTVASIGVVPN